MSNVENTLRGVDRDAGAREGFGQEPRWFEHIQPQRSIIRARTYDRIKRGLDIGLTIIAAPLLVPTLVVCWVLVKAGSPRAPALFVQTRTGKDGCRFRMYKFRTMVPDAESLKAELLERNQREWPDFKIKHDPRVTSLGRFLRTSSLDELPQFLNILKGDMTLVGPRPTSFGAETYAAWQRERLTVMPGLTGLWQIEGRGDMDFDERVEIDLAYIERLSLSLDVQIMVRTVTAVLKGRGAS